jgi:ABC-type bacteriocin/lantibiotic exporter with double-glycine peptidase domain
MFAVLVVGIFETGTLAAIALFVTAIASPEAIETSRIFRVMQLIPVITFPEDPTQRILYLSIAVALLVVLKNGLLAWVNYWKARFTAANESYIGMRLVEMISSRPYSWYINQNTGDLTSLVSWRMHVGMFFNSTLLFIQDGIVVTLLVGGLILLQPLVTVIVIGVVALFACAVYFVVKRRMDKVATAGRNLNRQSYIEASSIVHGFKDIKISCKEDFFVGRHHQNLKKYIKINARQKTFEQSPTWLLETAGFIAISATIVVMLTLLNAEQSGLFALIALLAVTAWRVLPGVNRIIKSATQVRGIIPYVGIVLENIGPGKLNSEKIDIPDAHDGSTDSMKKIHSLSVKNADFIYPKAEGHSLFNVSCNFTIGKTYAIIGPSGSGKSTLLDIITGLLRPSSGEIYVDDEVLHTEEDFRRLRLNIGYVSQNPYFIDGSVAENIAFGIPPSEIDRSRVLDVCEAAAVNFIHELSSGIDTIIGDKGIRLSGGQRQRIALARALYTDPTIIILDEGTNALDEKTEFEIHEDLLEVQRTSGDKIIIIVAHRTSSLKNIDILYWIDNGRIIEQGAPGTLLSRYRY